MIKKAFLALATLSLTVVAYYALSRGDQPGEAKPDVANSSAARIPLPRSGGGATITTEMGPLTAGGRTSAVIYDDLTGRPKYRFAAELWEPVSSNKFRLEDLEIQIYTPRGQITYIRADAAEVTLAGSARNNPDLKRGTLHGNVRVTIDRTTTEWRDAHPEQAERDAHPDALIHITLDDAQFDMERAELTSDGPLVVDSKEARIDRVTGLTLQWNQINNRIDSLLFHHGGRMELRRGGRALDFALPGAERKTDGSPAPSGAPTETTPGFAVPRARAMQPTSIARISAEEAAQEIRIEGGSVVTNRPISLDPAEREAVARSERIRSREELVNAAEQMRREARAGKAGQWLDSASQDDRSNPARENIDSYRAVFNHSVVVEQIDGLKTLARIDADRLEINFDVGSRLRSVADADPSAKAPSAAADDGQAAPGDANTDSGLNAGTDHTKLVLTWDGLMELRPLHVEPEHRTGERFDAIVTGQPVVVSGEQGRATCDQLVYRHERRQIWLSGTSSRAVVLAVDEGRRLTAREVFFDQERGLARIDGPGTMLDTRRGSTTTADPGVGRLAAAMPKIGSNASRRSDSPVRIEWTRGVDVEIGRRPVFRTDPATGMRTLRQQEYLSRAWFHGDVRIREGVQFAAGDELAVTFGAPRDDREFADHIRHIDIAGDVRLEGVDSMIAAQHLAIEMMITLDGRNVPRVADADGGVTAREGTLEFSARRMHVVLTDLPEQSRMAVERIEAEGDVNVLDPGPNLKISRAETLKAVIRDGKTLARVTIVSSDPQTLARVRYNDVAIHGHRIEINGEAETVDVPGPGKTWMVTRSDFGGRKLGRPQVVKTTWSKEMRMRFAQDYGVFVGDVRSRSDEFNLDCDKLTIRFARVPPPKQIAPEETGPKEKSLLERIWALGPIRGDSASVIAVAEGGLAGRVRPRPVYVLAEGRASAERTTYGPKSADGTRGPLRDRLYIAADRIGVDLNRRQVSVPAAGSFTIEDYAMEAAGRRTSSSAAPLMSSVRSEGPSQTAIQWDNAMDFFLDRNLVVFDENVRMVHRSGQQMVQKQALADAMGLDLSALRLPDGRRTDLTCGNLLIEFRGDQSGETKRSNVAGVRATELERLIARGAVYLKDGTKSLMGERLQYLRPTDEIILEGSDSLDARIIDESEDRYSVMKQRVLIWNRKTNRIEAPNPRFHSARR